MRINPIAPWLPLLVLVAWLLQGCAALPDHPDAGEKLAHFQALEADPRVLHEPGAEALAARLQPLLPQAMALVEAAHELPFAAAPRVYVCGSDACFRAFVPEPPNLTAAVAYDNRLLLHPRLFDREPERLAPVLAHELSHLHLGQRIGHYSPAVPVWFHEGLASHAAGGGGADLVTEMQAREAIRAGRHFLPAQRHDAGVRRNAAHWDLDMSLFYRQSLMLVEHLKARSEQAFRQLLLSIQEKTDFNAAFESAYGASAGTLAGEFFRGLKEPR
jgi:hypothetical protein